MMTLFRTLLLVSLFSANLIAGEIRPIAPPAYGSMNGIASPASVAYGPTGGLAVWRIAFDSIWGVALDAAGRPLSPARMLVNDREGTDRASVHYAHGRFTLWWRPSSGTKRAVLADDLSVIDLRRIGGAFEPLASNAAYTLARNVRFDASNEIHFFDSEGNRVRHEVLSEVDRINFARATVLTDGTFALATSGYDGLFLTRFSVGGERLNAPLAIEFAEGTTSSDYRPHLGSLAADGTAVLIAALASTYDVTPDVKTYRIERDDTVSARHIVVANRWSMIRDAELQAGPGGFTLAFRAGDRDAMNAEHFDLFAARLDRDGALATEIVPIFATAKTTTALTSAASGGKHLLFFQNGDYGAGTIFTIALPEQEPIARPDVTVVDAVVSDGPATQLAPRAASDGTGWLAVWLELLAESVELRAVVLNADGSPAGPPLMLRSIFRYLRSADVVFDGVDYVVSWVEGHTLYALRVTRDGSLKSGAPTVITTVAGEQVSTAARNGVTMFAWDSNAIQVATMRADGSVTTPIRISGTARWEGNEYVSYERPIVAAGESSFLVAWWEDRYLECGMIITCPGNGRAQARLVSTFGIPRFGQLELGSREIAFVAGADGTFLIRDLSRVGVLIDASSAQARELILMPRPERTGQHFGVNGEYILPYMDTSAAGPVRIRRFTADGVPVATQTTDAVGFPSAASPAGTLLVLWTPRVVEAPWNGAPAIVSQVIDTFLPYAPPARQRSAGR